MLKDVMSESNETRAYSVSGDSSKRQLGAMLLVEQAVRSTGSGRYKRWERLLPIAFFAATVVVRVVVAWNLPLSTLRPDRREYQHLAHNLIETGRYGFNADWREDPILSKSQWSFMYDETGTCRDPGYPVVLAALELTVGSDLRVYQAVFAIIEGFTAVLVFYLGKLLFGNVGGIIAALICVSNLGMCYYLTWVGREPFLVFFFVCGLYIVFRAVRSSRYMLLGILAGLCFGIGTYFKETTTYLGLIAALWLLYIGFRHQRHCWKSGLVMLSCILLLRTPWIARNWLACKKYAGFSNFSNLVMWYGLVDRDWRRHQTPELDPHRAATAFEADRRCKEQLKLYAREQPLGVVRAMVTNVGRFWSPVPIYVWMKGFDSPSQVVALVYYLLYFFFAAWSFWIFRRWEETQLCLLLLLAMTGLHALVAGFVRYRLVFDPLWFIFIGGALQAWFESRRAACT